jgi:predicted RND superfamily exporter protein
MKEFSLNRPKLTLTGFLILTLFSVWGLTKLKSDYSTQYWFSTDSVHIKNLARFERLFGNEQNIIISVTTPNSEIGKNAVKTIGKISAILEDESDIISVRSLTHQEIIQGQGDNIEIAPLIELENIDSINLNKKLDFASSHPMLKNYLINKSKNTSLIIGVLRPFFGSAKKIDYSALVKSVEQKVLPLATKNLDLRIAGLAKYQEVFRSIAMNDMKVLAPILLILVFSLLFYFFKSFYFAALSLSLVCLSILYAFSFAALLGLRFENILATVPAILFAIGIADSIHFFNSYNSKGSVKDSLLKNYSPTFLTSITTSIGFLGFLWSDLRPINNLGITVAFGTFMAWMLTVYMLPAILTLSPSVLLKTSQRNTLDLGFLYPLIKKNRLKIIATFSILTLLCIFLGLKNEINATPSKYVPTDNIIRVNTNFIKEKIGATTGPELLIDTKAKDGVKSPYVLKRISALLKDIESWNFVSRSISILDIIKDLNKALHAGKADHFKIPKRRDLVSQLLLLYSFSATDSGSLNQFISTDGRYTRATIFWDLSDSKDNLFYFKKIKILAKKHNLDVIITGNSSLGKRMNKHVVSTFIRSILSTFIIILPLLCFIFRSFKLGLISLFPNIIPLIFVCAFMYINGESIDVGAVLVFSVCFGIAVDDTIHFIFHHKNKMPVEENIKSTGSALILTTICLSLGFGIFIFAEFVPNKNFGLYSSITLIIALVTDLILLPAILPEYGADT